MWCRYTKPALRLAAFTRPRAVQSAAFFFCGIARHDFFCTPRTATTTPRPPTPRQSQSQLPRGNSKPYPCPHSYAVRACNAVYLPLLVLSVCVPCPPHLTFQERRCGARAGAPVRRHGCARGSTAQTPPKVPRAGGGERGSSCGFAVLM